MTVLEEAKALQGEMVGYRRFFHQNAEVGMDIPLGVAFIKARLEEMGVEPSDCGKSGVSALIGGKKAGRTFLLRADIDALPIFEESGLDFRSKTGNMHACGHDFHISMLLGAARILKNHESEINGRVKLMFQPGEELLQGAGAMIEAGIMENPSVDAAMMIHVFAGTDHPTGTVLFSNKPAAAYDRFEINVRGKGCHGAMPDQGVDPLNIMNHIYLALQALNAREVGPYESVALTIGQMTGGAAANIIPETAYMTGTLRTVNEELRKTLKERLTAISQGVALAFRGEATVLFPAGCPALVPDEFLNGLILGYTRELLGDGHVIFSEKPSLGMGSEDFSFVTGMAPGTFVCLSAGAKEEGYRFPLHHPKTTFNESALPIGAAVHANTALRWLENN